MSNKRKVNQEHELTPKHKTRLTATKKSKVESPTIDLRTPPQSHCSTPKSQYSDDSLSQDFSPGVDIDVGWKSKKRSVEKKRLVKVPKFAKALAKEQFERNKMCRKQPQPKCQKPEMSALEKFKMGIKKLEMNQPESPRSSKTNDCPGNSKEKENVTRNFIFGLSDDSDDEAYASWNSLIKKIDELKESKQLPVEPIKNDENWRKTKSAQELNTSSSSKVKISEPHKDLFDDSISDSLLYQCSQQVEQKLATTKKKSPIKSTDVVDNPLENDSDDDILSSFPLEDIVGKSGLIDNNKKQSGSSFARHNSLPCQSKITLIVQKVNNAL